MDELPDRDACRASAEKARERADAQLAKLNGMEEEVLVEKGIYHRELKAAQDAEEREELYESIWERRLEEIREADRKREEHVHAQKVVEQTLVELKRFAAQANAAAPSGLPEPSARSKEPPGRSRSRSVHTEEPAEEAQKEDEVVAPSTLAATIQTSKLIEDNLEDRHDSASPEHEAHNSPSPPRQQRQQATSPEQRQSIFAEMLPETVQPAPRRTRYAQPLPDLIPNIFEIVGQYEAISCAIPTCLTNQHRKSKLHFKSISTLKRHANKAHGEQFKATFTKQRTSDAKFLASEFVDRVVVSEEEIEEMRRTGILPNHLQLRAPESEFPLQIAKRKKRSAADGDGEQQGASRKRTIGTARRTFATVPAIEEEVESGVSMIDPNLEDSLPQDLEQSSAEKMYAPPSRDGVSWNSQFRFGGC